MSFLETFWHFLVISSPYLLMGFLISGVVHQFLNAEKIKKLLGRNKLSDVFWASLLGVPLPLCSCSVLPTAATLRKAGASNGATSSFLISTPESGIDSIAMSYSVLDLPMAIFRPICAFITAMIAGVAQHIFNDFQYISKLEKKEECCGHDHKHDHSYVKKEKSIIQKILNFSFVELLDDMVNWLSLGLVLGAIISFIFPDQFFENFNPHVNRFLILLVSVPVYICASASTPIAASLILKGLSPGTALIFLLAGPATNISNIAVIQKYIGKKGVVINIISIVLVAYAASYLVDAFYLNNPMSIKLAGLEHEHYGVFYTACAVIFLILLLSSLYRVNLKRIRK